MNPSILSQLYPNSPVTQVLNPAQTQASTAPAPTPQPQQPQSKGNFLTHLLPTAGAIIGGIAGIPGDFLGGAGSIAGAAGGSALGKALENKLEGNGIASGVGVSALEGGAGQGIGMGAGSILGKLIKPIAGKLGGVAADMVQGQVAKGLLSDTDAQALREAGITDMRQVPQIYDAISGKNGALSSAVRSTLGSLDSGVDITGLDQTAARLASENGLMEGAPVKAINANLKSSLRNMLPGDVTSVASKKGDLIDVYEPGSLKNALPENAFAQVQNFEKLAAMARSKGFNPVTNSWEDANQAGLYNVYKGLSQELEGKVFGEGGAGVPLTDEVKKAVIDALEPVKSINPRAYASYVSKVAGAANLQDLRPIQANIVRAFNAVQGTANIAGKQAGMTAADVAKGAGAPISLSLAHPVAALGSLVLSSPMADRLGASVLGNASDVLGSVGANPATQSIIKGAGGALGATVATSPNLIQGGSGTGVTPVETPQASPTPQAGATGGLNPLQVAYLEEAAINPSLYQNIALTPEQRQTAQSATQAQSALGGLMNIFNNAGGGRGLVLGELTRLGGMFGGSPRAFQQQRAQVASQISAATGVDAAKIEAGLPSLTDTKQAAELKLANIQNLLNTTLQSSQQTGLAGLGFSGLGQSSPSLLGGFGAVNPLPSVTGQ